MNKLHPLQQSLFPQNPLEPAQMLAPLTSGQLVLAIVVSFLEESFSTEYQTPPTDSLKKHIQLQPVPHASANKR